MPLSTSFTVNTVNGLTQETYLVRDNLLMPNSILVLLLLCIDICW